MTASPMVDIRIAAVMNRVPIHRRSQSLLRLQVSRVRGNSEEQQRDASRRVDSEDSKTQMTDGQARDEAMPPPPRIAWVRLRVRLCACARGLKLTQGHRGIGQCDGLLSCVEEVPLPGCSSV